MLRKRGWLGLLVLAVASLGITAGIVNGQKMQEIKFDIGRNIVETAKNSGVPSFQSGKTYTRIDYGVSDIPEGISARFTRPGYEITWPSLYAFTLYTDEKEYKDLEVFHASLMQRYKAFKTHDEVRRLVENTLSQFQKGKWQRYYEPYDARLTGRSSYLNEAGELDTGATGALDPEYRIAKAEWEPLAEQGMSWVWVGEGVLATLEVSYRSEAPEEGTASSGLDYSIDLEFESLAHVEKYTAINEAIRLKEGDEKGWNSTAKQQAGRESRKEAIKVLEANAVKRGDSVVPVP